MFCDTFNSTNVKINLIFFTQTFALAGSRSRWYPLGPPHGAHLHLPGAAKETLWHSHRLLNTLPDSPLEENEWRAAARTRLCSIAAFEGSVIQDRERKPESADGRGDVGCGCKVRTISVLM